MTLVFQFHYHKEITVAQSAIMHQMCTNFYHLQASKMLYYILLLILVSLYVIFSFTTLVYLQILVIRLF